MRTNSYLFIATILVGSLMSSCNLDKDDDDFRTYPDLTATVTITGAVTDNFTFTNSENGGGDGVHGLHGSHSGEDNIIVISGTGVNTMYNITADLSTVRTGVFNLEDAGYLYTTQTEQVVFEEMKAGSLTITDAKLLWTQGAAEVYRIDGMWSVEIENDESPVETISITCSFDNLVIISVP